MTALRHLLRGVRDRGPDVGGDRAEIAALRRRVDLHHRLDIVLRDHRARGRPRDVGDAAEDRRRARVPAAVIGSVSSALSESIWYCGVCITIE